MKKQLLVCGALLAVLVSAAVGFAGGAILCEKERTVPAAGVQFSATEADPLEQFRLEREQLRQMQTAQLNDLIYGGEAEDEIVLAAKRRLLDMMDWQEKETTIEGVLRMREFEDAIVTVHADSVNVLIRSETLNRQQTAVILELVMRETGISGGNVKIIPIN